MKTCPTRDDFSDLVDGAISQPRRLALWLHARNCTACAAILAEEQVLTAALRNCESASSASAHLRLAVLSAAATGPIARPQSRRFAKVAMPIALFAAVALTAVVQLRSPGGTPLAYAAVEKSMGEVKTARWVVHHSNYKSATGKTQQYSVQMAARMDPPALSTTYSGSPPLIMKPEMFTFRHNGKDFGVYTGPPWAGFFSLEHDPVPTAATVLRRHILSQLVVPEHPVGGAAFWQCEKVIRDGRLLWRFDWGSSQRGRPERQKSAEISRESSSTRERLTRMAYRWTLWVDPATRRVVRSENELYTGDEHIYTVADGFVYDEPLPNALFQPDLSQWPYSLQKKHRLKLH